MSDRFCYFNGDILADDKIFISPEDLGFVRGYGIFDAMRTVNGKLFLFDSHWDRLKSSVEELNIKINLSKKEFEGVINNLLEKNKFKESAIKTIITGGVSEDGITMKDSEPTIFIAVKDLKDFLPSEELKEKGIGVITLDFARFLPNLKTLNYVAAIKSQKEKERFEAKDIIYIKEGDVLEGSTSNVFIVKDGKIITPNNNILKGTFRDFIIRIAKKNNIKIEERNVSEKELLEADEVFVTGTYKSILPVVKINDMLVSNGSSGKTTKELMFLVEEFIRKY
jgi:branched-chain amino acid aminotransferase